MCTVVCCSFYCIVFTLHYIESLKIINGFENLERNFVIFKGFKCASLYIKKGNFPFLTRLELLNRIFKNF